MLVKDLRIKTTEAAKIVGLDRVTLAAWLARYWPEAGGLIGSEGGGMRGADRIFSFRHLIAFALTKELIEANVVTSCAANAATEFLTFGEIDQSTGAVLRKPGLPFRDWRSKATLVALHREAVAVVSYDPKEQKTGSILDRVRVKLRHPSPLWGSIAIADARSPFLNICRELGADPDEVLAEYYGEVQQEA